MLNQIQNIDKALDNVKTMEKSERVFTRLVSKKLTPEEARKVAGGECKFTNDPNADVKCDY
jgi:hypothetical protein